jgi:serine/threonine-protein kinase
MAPEQFAGKRMTERTDLYALGLVLHELFTGQRLFAASTDDDAGAPAVDLAPEIQRIIDACVQRDPARRPSSARAVAAMLPGVSRKTLGVLRPVVASLLLAGVVAGTAAVSSRAAALTVAPSEVPKSAEALAERARSIVAAVGVPESAADEEFWFRPDPVRPGVRFIYRQSTALLIPQNLFHVVTEVDPPADRAGMTTVTLDSQGQLIDFDRVPVGSLMHPPAGGPIDWRAVFAAAGLKVDEFVPAAANAPSSDGRDDVRTWVRRSPSAPQRVTTGAVEGHLTRFSVETEGSASGMARNPFATGRTAPVEVTTWAFVALIFVSATLVARRNLRIGRGDRRAARTLAIVISGNSMLFEILRAHHVPSALEELRFAFGACAWALLWGLFVWIVYISLEPYIRRAWPHTLTSWNHLLCGRMTDPLIGRDALIGLLAGVVRTGMAVGHAGMAHRPPPLLFFTGALESLRSGRQFVSMAIVGAMHGAVGYGLGTLFLVFLVRLAVRRTWIAVMIVALLAIPLGFWAGDSPPPAAWEMAWMVGGMTFGLVVLMRVGLLAHVVMLMITLLIAVTPVTLDVHAWYFGTSLVTLLLITAAALYGFFAAVGSHLEAATNPA